VPYLSALEMSIIHITKRNTNIVFTVYFTVPFVDFVKTAAGKAQSSAEADDQWRSDE